MIQVSRMTSTSSDRAGDTWREDPSRQLAALLSHATRLKRRRWRQLVWLCGPVEQCRALAEQLWQAGNWHNPLWIGDSREAPVKECLPPGKARTRLGGEHQLVVVDTGGRHGFDPDALGALAGTLTAGGLCVLMTPTNWGEQPDPDYARFADHPWAWQQLSARYLARLARLLESSCQVVRLQVGGPLHLPALGGQHRAKAAKADRDCVTAEQAALVKALVGLKRRRPLVVTADRGRGKSAALGIACARLLQGGVSRIVVTAPRLSAVESLFERLAVLCPQGERCQSGYFALPDGAALCFVPPDQLIEQVMRGEQGGAGSYLMVDEAAAIPAALLAQWLAAFPRIAFATTVHGYEGSGRGFALRFRTLLERQTPQWRGMTLSAPVRWATGDPLEATTRELLLLDAELPLPRPGHDTASTDVSRDALGGNEAQLQALFGLLVQSHYRTTPSDLRQLLDGPGTALRVIEAQGAPQAVLVTRDEGNFAPALAEQVAQGVRRPQGHLLAQSLAAHCGSRAALTARWRRVARIATHPDRRREGLGALLLADDQAAAKAAGIALYGATFGAEASLLRFWLGQGFRPVRLGVTREAATGEYAVMVASALDESGAVVLEALREQFAAALPGLLAFELRALPADVVVQLLGTLDPPVLGQAVRQTLHDVAYARRDPALARPALQQLACRTSHTPLAVPQREALASLAAWAFQNQPLAAAQREALTRLREAVRLLMETTELFPADAER